MPFPDELARGLSVVKYDPEWPDAFTHLAERLDAALAPLGLAIDHIGSTSVPGLSAKDSIDVQVRVDALSPEITTRMSAIGFRERPEVWNHLELSGGLEYPKLVFAPPSGERASNVHVRLMGSATARRNLLFRDFLRADDAARTAWSDFKVRLARMAADIYEYGQAKAGPTEILMIAAEAWAQRTNWRVDSART